MTRPDFDLSLYLVIGPDDVRYHSLEDVVALAVKGGVSLVQLRDKTADKQQFVELGRSLQGLLKPAGLPLIINDRVEEAMALGAAGVHVGQDDMPARLVRQVVGPDRLVGLSSSRPKDAQAADPQVVDYLGAGPVNVTSSKADAKKPIAAEGVGAICEATSLPVVAIGGIQVADVPALVRAGVSGVAVVSAICSAKNPESAARELRQAVDRART
ncbi:thiamine phosphate synthase [Fodinicurvata sediminis]|uniref:thiamine phosphate synthase n=1 Tax=Fodinicurvata sediminis TaxID=1121832 RepID=UPI0003B70863|nr:thiamine phosphate synthase [Fodinicurvata sediminis]